METNLEKTGFFVFGWLGFFPSLFFDIVTGASILALSWSGW